MSLTLASRTVDGIEIPAAGTWNIDPSHSSVGFTARHLMVAKVRGRFGAFEGSLQIGDGPGDSSATISIDAASIDTRDDKRDEHLRSEDFLDVATFPHLTFHSTAVQRTGPNTFDLVGELRIRDVTRPVVLSATYDGVTADPWGNTRAVFSAGTEIDREEFGLTWNVALEAGGVLVGKLIKIAIEIEAVRAV